MQVLGVIKNTDTPPTVTIITMTLNAERFIQQTLDSVANQDYPDIEHLVVDGGSTDHTLDIVRKHRSLNAQIISEPDNGTSDAMNKGFAMASGKYVWALNADDTFANYRTISRLVRHLETNPSCDFVFGDMIMVDERSERIGRRRYHDQYGFLDLLCDRRQLPFVGCLLRKSVIDSIGGFDEELGYCNDLDFLLRLSLYGRMDYILEDTGIFRLHSQSSTSINTKEAGQESIAVCLKYSELPETRTRFRGRGKEIKAAVFMHAAGVCFRSGAPTEVRGHIIEALRLNPFSLAAVKPWAFLIASFLGPRSIAAIVRTIRRLNHTRHWYWLNNMLSPSAPKKGRF
jgi:glycosyltransferase involved in cell wall biosynthesis